MKPISQGSIQLVPRFWHLAIAVNSLSAAVGQPAENVDQLVGELTSEAPMIAEGARRQLRGWGESVVPFLFEKLLVSDWTLRPRLLEVLSTNGREFAKRKLFGGNETEKIYAALVYELSITCAGEDHDYNSPEFTAMTQALLTAIKSEDKHLRAAAGAALVYDDNSTVFFDHLHDIVPALISSFDTELIIDRCNRGGPVQVVFIVMGINLTVLIGDRFIDVETEVFTRSPEPKDDYPRDPQAFMRRVLSANRSQVEQLRTHWEMWWREHSHLSAVEIGVLMIERSIAALPADPSAMPDQTAMAAQWCLEKWTGSYNWKRQKWQDWWDKNNATYRGPIKRRR